MPKPFIVNASEFDVYTGQANVPVNGLDTIMIRIRHKGGSFHEIHSSIKVLREYRFTFDDVDEGDPNCIEEKQASDLCDILEGALEKNLNVIVHCGAGISRSGAVVEFGTMLGFEDTGKTRIPNAAVKSALMRKKGWAYE